MVFGIIGASPFSIIRYIGVNIKSGTVRLVILILDVRRTVIYHGTGCTLPSAIAAYIAGEYAVCDAVVAAKEYISIAIQPASLLERVLSAQLIIFMIYSKRRGCF